MGRSLGGNLPLGSVSWRAEPPGVRCDIKSITVEESRNEYQIPQV